MVVWCWWWMWWWSGGTLKGLLKGELEEEAEADGHHDHGGVRHPGLAVEVAPEVDLGLEGLAGHQARRANGQDGVPGGGWCRYRGPPYF